MKKVIFGALALALISFTSCRNEESTEAVEESMETAINTEVIQQVVTEAEDSIEVETEKTADTMTVPSEMEQDTTKQ